MVFFTSNNPGAEIFVSVGTGCPTWCQSCHKTIKENSSLSLDEITYQIQSWHELSDDNFSFFIYGNDALKNPHILSTIEYIKKLKRHVKIQIPIYTKYTQLTNFIDSNNTSIFVVSKKIESKKQVSDIINSIKELYGKNNIFINYDLLIDLKYKQVFEKIFNTISTKEEDWFFSITARNIKVTLRSLYYINYKDRKIENLRLTSCMIYDSFHIHKNSIEIHDHFEIEPNGDITFHNPLCYIWQPKITNIYKKNAEMLIDFKKYKDIYLNNLNHDLEKNCFTCITKKYNYDNL